MENRVKFGLSKVHYAVITETDGAITYGEPVHIIGGVSLTATPKGNKAEFYADNMPWFVGSVNQGYEGTLEVAIVPDKFKIDVLGYKKDGNGILFEDANVIAKNIALMFEFAGDINAIRYVFFNVAVERSSITSATANAAIEVKTDIFNITASPAIETGLVKAKAELGSEGYDEWFNQVYSYVNPII